MKSIPVIFRLLAILTIATLSQSQLHYFQEASSAYRAHSHYQVESSGLASSPEIIATQPEHSVAHPAVIANAQRESQLPSELLKSERFYKNPHIAAALAKESWFTDKEMPVIDRVAEKIPREMIFKLFHNAGWIRRR